MEQGLTNTFTKIIYFDEGTAQDYLDITHGGRLDWNKEENKQRAAKILAEIEANAQGRFNILNIFKTGFSADASASYSNELAKIIDTTLHNTVLTDYINSANDDKYVVKIKDDGVYAPENSVSMYKMISSYLTIVPKENMPIDMDKLNAAVLERGYYGMLLKSENPAKHLLRFNIKAFKNNYNLADLSKMSLTFYGIKVGTCTKNELTIDKEFILQKSETSISAEQIVDGSETQNVVDEMDVIDVVLAGVIDDQN